MTDTPDRYYIGEIIYDELAYKEYLDMNDCQEAADLILASEWMAAHDAEVVAAARAEWEAER